MSENNQILLVIDNEESAKYLMEHLIIGGGYSVTVEASVAQALETFRQNAFSMVITKLISGDPETPKLVRGLMEIDVDTVVVGYSEKISPELYQEASKLGFYDVIVKPINIDRMFFVIKRSMDLHGLLVSQRRHLAILKEQNSSLQKQNILLAKRIEESTKNLARLYEDLRSTYLRTIRALAQAIDARDHYTHSHSENVSKYSVLIAEEMKLSVKEIEGLREAAELHDIGKIGISDLILSKPSSLTQEEWQQIKTHPQTGSQILEPLTFLSDVIELVKQHHEHYDGSGYPMGLKAEGILLGARILHVADAFEAMTSARSYRQVPFTKDMAVAEIKDKTGTQFDPEVVSAFLKIAGQIVITEHY
jgi:putative two-component system response regulator